MADFICLAMASQYTESNNNPESNTIVMQQQQTANSFRRSLGASTLFGRRSSRSNTANNTGSSIMNRPTSDLSIIVQSNNEEMQQQNTTHIRIVPSIDNPSRSLVFNIIERDLEVGRVIKIGRFTDRSSIQNHISFKSKVVSRSHCEIWVNNEGKVQLKDTKSSSGTFVNHVRLSPANTESRPVEIRDGDLVQLGVDYQGGFEEIYRSVKMRFEVNRQDPSSRPVSYSMSAFNNLRNLTSLTTADQQQEQVIHPTASTISPASRCHNIESTNNNPVEVEECCICLYALAPFQALFVAPCSHSYHFKCIRPLFESYPGFQCPICRTYSDLDASVAIEAEEVIEKFGLRKSSTNHTQVLPTTTTTTTNHHHEEEIEEDEEEELQENNGAISSSSSAQPTNMNTSVLPTPQPELPLSTTLVSCSTSLSGIVHTTPRPRSSTSSNQDIAFGGNERQGDHRATIVFEDDNVITSNQSQHGITNSVTSNGGATSRITSNYLVEKIKMAFSNDRRKSIGNSKRRTLSCNSDSGSSDEDLSEGAFFDNLPCSSSSSPPSSPRSNHLQPILSRQSTQYNALAEIVEEPVVGSSSRF